MLWGWLEQFVEVFVDYLFVSLWDFDWVLQTLVDVKAEELNMTYGNVIQYIPDKIYLNLGLDFQLTVLQHPIVNSQSANQ